MTCRRVIVAQIRQTYVVRWRQRDRASQACTPRAKPKTAKLKLLSTVPTVAPHGGDLKPDGDLRRCSNASVGWRIDKDPGGRCPGRCRRMIGGSAGARTQDQYLKRVLLYQLSYRPGNLGEARKRAARTGRASYTTQACCQPLGAFAGIRFKRSVARRAASLSGYFCVTSSSVLRESA